MMTEVQEREAIEWMRVQAKMSREFYAALVEQGFNRAQALALAQTWLASFNRRPPQQEDK